ncbi:hypothetical protein C7N83_10820 [Neisseria iguanae]|uniref:AAA domain-containing protein n=1 Tax=Neisseria iguanae TaxID=90242 RepID=A0A2P7TY58_9NEIS|nr:hypothetical protein C7N83_10820 [Neisseria iguanae]
MGKDLIKVFTGQRCVGKSDLLFQIMQEINKREDNAAIIYVNQENLAFTRLKTDQDLNNYIKVQKKTNIK